MVDFQPYLTVLRDLSETVYVWGGWSGGREGGELFKLSPNKDLLLLSVDNIDLTYFCYNSI